MSDRSERWEEVGAELIDAVLQATGNKQPESYDEMRARVEKLLMIASTRIEAAEAEIDRLSARVSILPPRHNVQSPSIREKISEPAWAKGMEITKNCIILCPHCGENVVSWEEDV